MQATLSVLAKAYYYGKAGDFLVLQGPQDLVTLI